MKKSKILYLFAFLMVGAWLGSPASAQPGASVSFQTFYNELSPYGRWTSHPQYGSIWTPYNVDRDFQPYATNGQWMMTEYGNTWVSDYDWGWAPFHYGRWFHDNFYGWAWVPDYQWGPAWVDWRSGGGYYGWAPLWPGVRVGVSFDIPFNFWVFVPQRYVYRPRVFGYCVYGNRYRNVYNQTTIINNYYRNDNRVYAYGPRRSEIERVTRGSVPVYRAEELRSNGYASARQNSDGSYRASGSSESGLTRGNRDNGNATSNRSGRQSAEADNGGSSNRSYDAGSSSRSRGSYEAGSSRNPESTTPGRSYESGEPSSRARSSYEARPSVPSSGTDTYNSAPSRSYESAEPSSRARSGYDRSSTSGSGTYNSTPNRSYESGESSRTRSSSEYNSNSRARSMESAPSRGSSSEYAQPSRSSSPRMEAPAARSQRSEASPRSNSGSSSSGSSSSSRSRGPR